MAPFPLVPSDDSAASPVVGAVLMVAIVVLLAAVVGSFALGFTPGSERVEQAVFGFDYDADAGVVTITHESGARYSDENTYELAIRITDADGTTETFSWVNDDDASDLADYPIGSGDRVTINETGVPDPADVSVGFKFERGDEIELLWFADDRQSAVVASYTFGRP